MLLLILLVSSAFAHNWFNSPSRAGSGERSQKASTKKPCPPRSSSLPHVQVRSGQKFQVEWVVGHSRHTYLTVINAKDSDKMQVHTSKVLDEYFAGCPAGQQGTPGKEWQKWHRKATQNPEYDPNRNKNGQPPFIPNYFKFVPKSDQWHVARDAKFLGSFKGARRNRIDPANVYQFDYPAAARSTDRRCEYTNDKYPWILSSARYLHAKHQPSRPDFAMLRTPTGSPTGSYVVHYIWSGYYDCVDVQVVNVQRDVANPYGRDLSLVAPPPPTYKRIDHCTYPDNKPSGKCIIMKGPKMPTPEECFKQCSAQSKDTCNAVVVVPAKNPSSVYPGFANEINIPWGSNCTKPGSIDDETYVCYPLKSRLGSALDFPYYSTSDTEDPIFYSSCFSRIEPQGFAVEQGEPALEPGEWEFRGKCISCKDRLQFASQSVTPHWRFANECIHCKLRIKGAVDPRLEAYLPFESGQGRMADNLGLVAELKGDAAFISQAAVGKFAVQLSGDKSSYVDLGDLDFSGGAFTVCAFAYFDKIDGTDPRIISKAKGSSRDDHQFMLSSESNGGFKARFRLKVLSGSTSEVVGSATLAPKKWVHICGTYDKKTLRLYQDGNLVGSTNQAGEVRAQPGTRINIGRNSNNDKPMAGKVDDVRIYKVALTAAEVGELLAQKN